jgi:4-diphosphocytidyl-2-C-methyl-D-erythritol kinase
VLKLKAYAKINLSLKILGKRTDGYHALDSIMQSISLFDLISLETIPEGIQLTTSNLPAGRQGAQLPTDNRNLAYKAAQAMFKTINARRKTSGGVKIDLQKNIPLAAGLAGGSADAAAVIFGLNLMSGNILQAEELLAVGAQVGSDVPFCLQGGNCRVRGRGEMVERTEDQGVSRYFVLVVPEVEVSTRWAYEAWDEESLKFKVQKLKILNDLEPIVIEKYPVIQKIKDRLLEAGCLSAQMSGSGSSVFGEISSAQLGEKIVSSLKKEYPNSYFVSTVGRGVEEIV